MTNHDDPRLDELLARWERGADENRDLSPLELCPDGSPALLAALTEGIECLKRFRGAFDSSHPEDEHAAAFQADEYEGIEEIEQGGQGRVIRARDRRLGREVAIKVPKARRARTESVRRRFEQEARICGNLEHPGVVPVYGLGHDSAGRPYYVMRYVKQERTLEHAIAAVHAMPAGPERTVAYQGLLRQFLTVCRTMAYAHDHGIVHRDLKPANVLVGEYGEVFVVDWGIAKQVRGEEVPPSPVRTVPNPCETAAGSRTTGVLGTPAFMSPEQAVDAGRVGPASDIYSLGATLYQVLTGRPPFVGEGGGVPAILRRVGAGTFTPPQRLDPSVPRALAAVCLKAMSHNPADRYARAGDLAAEVERWLADEPVTACRDPISVRLRRWTKRHRTFVAAVVALLLMSVVTLAVAAGLLADSNRQREEFIGQLKQTNAELADSNYRNQFYAAYAAWERMDVGRAEAILDECDPERRSFEWYYLKDLCRGRYTTLASPGQSDASLAASPDGKWVAYTLGREVRVVEAATGREVPLRGMRSGVVTLAFHPKGTQLAAITHDRDRPTGAATLAVWNLPTGELRSIQPENHEIRDIGVLAFRAGGREIVATRRLTKLLPLANGTVEDRSELLLTAWESATGKFLRDTPLHVRDEFAAGLASADATKLALWNSPHSPGVTVVSVAEPGSTIAIPGEVDGEFPVLGPVAISPDGQLVAVADPLGRDVRVWDSATGKKRYIVTGDRLGVHTLAFSPGGKLLAGGGLDRGIRLWNVASGREAATLRGHMGSVNMLTFLGDERLVSAGDGTVRSWKVTPAEVAVIGDLAGVYGLAFSPDGERLYSGHFGENPIGPRKVRVTRLANSSFEELPAVCAEFRISPDGATLAAVVENAVELWDVAAREKRRTIQNVGGPVAFSPDGSRLAMVSREEKVIRPAAGNAPAEQERTTVVLFDTATGELHHRLDHDRQVTDLAWHPRNGELFTITREATVTTWDAKTWGIARRFDSRPADQGQARAVLPRLEISRDGNFLATVADDSASTIRVWDPKTGQLRWEQKPDGFVTALAFTPDSRRLAYAGKDRTIRVCETATGRELLSLPGLREAVFLLAFRPDGRQLAGACPVVGAPGSIEAGQILVWGAQGGGR